MYYIWCIVALRMLLPFAPRQNLVGSLLADPSAAMQQLSALSAFTEDTAPAALPANQVLNNAGTQVFKVTVTEILFCVVLDCIRNNIRIPGEIIARCCLAPTAVPGKFRKYLPAAASLFSRKGKKQWQLRYFTARLQTPCSALHSPPAQNGRRG